MPRTQNQLDFIKKGYQTHHVHIAYDSLSNMSKSRKVEHGLLELRLSPSNAKLR